MLIDITSFSIQMDHFSNEVPTEEAWEQLADADREKTALKAARSWQGQAMVLLSIVGRLQAQSDEIGRILTEEEPADDAELNRMIRTAMPELSYRSPLTKEQAHSAFLTLGGIVQSLTERIKHAHGQIDMWLVRADSGEAPRISPDAT